MSWKKSKFKIDTNPLKKKRLFKVDCINLNLLMSLPSTWDLNSIEIKNQNAIKRLFVKLHFIKVK